MTSAGSTQTSCTAASFPLEPLAQAERQAESLVKRMTLGEEVQLMTGVGSFTPPAGTVGSTEAIPSLGIPRLNQQDGPGGVGDAVSGVTQLPAPEELAATFDPKAAACYGQVIGAEARRKGINLVYGPTVNIVRAPQWGRAFESLGEDPFLTGSIAAAEVTGMQRAGTMAQVKHYAVYNQETNRNTTADDSVVGEKALQEIYLRAWDQILGANPSSVMCSYATINGSNACQDQKLLDGFLDTTLHFPGFVGSDYFAVHSTVPSVDAGLDQEQPDPIYFGSALLSAVQGGQVKRSTIDAAVQRILTQMYRFRLFTEDATGSVHDDAATSADARIANQVADEGTTLLKNAGQTLPLSGTSTGTIAVIGPAADSAPITVGAGSATVTAQHAVSPLAGIRAVVGSRRPPTYTSGLPAANDFVPIPPADLITAPPAAGSPGGPVATLEAPETGTYEIAFSEPEVYIPTTLSINGTALVVNPGTPPRSTYTATVNLTAHQSYTVSGPVQKLSWVTPGQITQDIAGAAAAARKASTAVVIVGDGQESEGADRATLALPSDQDQLISAVASANKHTVVILDAGGPVLMPWLSEVSSVIDAWYPGESNGSSLAAVLFGHSDPSGHLPITFPTSTAQDPVASAAQFPGTDGEVQYSEGVDVGYRWYDATRTKPLFPFGFGLSYTSFRYSSPAVHVANDDGHPVVTVTVRVANTGKRQGADVAQVYLSQPATAGEPPRQLEAFQRLALDRGVSKVLSFTLQGLQLAHFDTSAGTWKVAAGNYRVSMGDSSAPQQLPVHIGFRISRSVEVGA
ncbi:MAG: beta-glucosidase family protein [Acidimicrobiales bacterium]